MTQPPNGPHLGMDPKQVQISDTDHFLKKPHVAWDALWIEFARELEEQRDEARAEASRLRDLLRIHNITPSL